MAQSFSGIKTLQYQGMPIPAAVKLADISGMSVPLAISWSDYGAASNPSLGVLIDLTPQNTAKALGQIRSVYMDNMVSQNPIYIIFPNTSTVVVIKPFSAGWFPVYTNQLQMTVYGLGFSPVGIIPLTKILVTNLPIPASTDIELDQAQQLWLASATISRGNTIYNQNLGVPALGDQFVQAVLDISTNGIVNLFGTPLSSGFIYVTDFNLFVGAQVVAASQCRLFFESTGISGVFMTEDFGVPIATFIPGLYIVSSRGNWKLDATQTWRVRNQFLFGNMSGAARYSFSYTINPN